MSRSRSTAYSAKCTSSTSTQAFRNDTRRPGCGAAKYWTGSGRRRPRSGQYLASATTGHSVARPGSLKRFLWAALSTQWVQIALEYYLIGRGLVRSVCSAWSAWHRHRDANVDVVLGRQSEYDFSPLLVARILGRPLVLEVHDSPSLLRQMRGRPRWKVIQGIESWQWRRCDRVWVNSDALWTIVRGSGVQAKHICTIPFGVDLDRFQRAGLRGAAQDVSVKVVFRR